ncbi:hypothetical protein DLJ82_5667 (plasmid) [Rhizobium leguminosarum]|uniref:Uncharacterized protein n=1 Tax=Rhizobium leguminosarum TaxID=384 RepID=A0A2Z4YRK0_RHILE|nr:hypothetical protein DLJ82_5667 [Rhizobium leguminosarum]
MEFSECGMLSAGPIPRQNLQERKAVANGSVPIRCHPTTPSGTTFAGDNRMPSKSQLAHGVPRQSCANQTVFHAHPVNDREKGNKINN